MLVIVVIGVGFIAYKRWEDNRQVEITQRVIAAKEAELAEKAKVRAEKVKTLRSWETTVVTMPYGPKGYIQYYWVKSGASLLYSLDEYKSAVSTLSPGADVEAPVAGARFALPWIPGR
jgi:hypothetical protein